MKQRYKSKTYWFNAIMGLFLLLEQLIPAMEYFLSDDWMRIYMGAVLAGNIILREFTHEAVGNKKPAN